MEDASFFVLSPESLVVLLHSPQVAKLFKLQMLADALRGVRETGTDAWEWIERAYKARLAMMTKIPRGPLPAARITGPRKYRKKPRGRK